jgi:hypothetical protein
MDEEVTVFDNIGTVIVEIFTFLYAYCEYCVDHRMI